MSGRSGTLRGMADSQTPNTPQDLSTKPNGSLVKSWLHHVGQYLSAIIHGWVALVSGLASIILLVLVAFWGDDWPFLKDNKKTFVWTAFICLVVAGFSAWRKERQRWERHDGLAALSITPKEMVRVYKGRTTVHGERLAKNYVGKWMRVGGTIHDVNVSTNWMDSLWAGTVFLGWNLTQPMVVLNFTRRWVHTLSALRKGDSINVIGRVRKVDNSTVWLERCELLEIGTRDTEKKSDES